MQDARYRMQVKDAGVTLNPAPCFLTTKGTKKKDGCMIQDAGEGRLTDPVP